MDSVIYENIYRDVVMHPKKFLVEDSTKSFEVLLFSFPRVFCSEINLFNVCLPDENFVMCKQRSTGAHMRCCKIERAFFG